MSSLKSHYIIIQSARRLERRISGISMILDVHTVVLKRFQLIIQSISGISAESRIVNIISGLTLKSFIMHGNGQELIWRSASGAL